jgi:mono/diheme cytochrome c family protein
VETRKDRTHQSLPLQASHEPVVGHEGNYKAAVWTEEGAAGEALVQKFSCATCHQIRRKAGGSPRDLVNSFRRDIANPAQHA